MRILAIDVGTGTQDILLFDSEQPIENGLQLVMPAPTQIVAGRIRAATAARPLQHTAPPGPSRRGWGVTGTPSPQQGWASRAMSHWIEV